MAKAKKLLRWLLVVTVFLGMVYAIVGTISLLSSEFTSFPWWSNLVFAGIYFGPVILLEAVGLLILRYLDKRKKV